jgi:Holliday junction resolvase RusA-like endonuclease
VSLGSFDGLAPATYTVPPIADPAVEFFIPGTPVQQGSKSGFSRMGSTSVQMTDQNAKNLKPWRHTIATHADRGVTFDRPVHVEATFVMPKPKRPRWTTPAVKPDIDKLTRALLDGLTDGGLIADDARVVSLLVKEEYAEEKNPVGVHVAVVAL